MKRATVSNSRCLASGDPCRRQSVFARCWHVESLETRRLLAAWGAVDSYQLAAGQGAFPHTMPTARQGNVYVAGSAFDNTGHNHGIVRERLAGGTSWTVIEDYTLPSPGAARGGVTFAAIA